MLKRRILVTTFAVLMAGLFPPMPSAQAAEQTQTYNHWATTCNAPLSLSCSYFFQGGFPVQNGKLKVRATYEGSSCSRLRLDIVINGVVEKSRVLAPGKRIRFESKKMPDGIPDVRIVGSGVAAEKCEGGVLTDWTATIVIKRD